MSAVAAPERRAGGRTRLASGLRPFDDRATLEAVILDAWEGVVVEGSCACPVCEGSMRPSAVGATCTNCASELS